MRARDWKAPRKKIRVAEREAAIQDTDDSQDVIRHTIQYVTRRTVLTLEPVSLLRVSFNRFFLLPGLRL